MSWQRFITQNRSGQSRVFTKHVTQLSVVHNHVWYWVSSWHEWPGSEPFVVHCSLGWDIPYPFFPTLFAKSCHEVLSCRSANERLESCLRRETKVDVTKCHTCHAKPRWMSPSATPMQRGTAPWATQRAKSAPPEPAQCPKCHASHAKRRWMSPSATPAMRNEGGCHQVQRLPRKTKSKMVCDKDGVWQSCVWKIVCDKGGVWKMVKVGVWQSCVWKMVCDKDRGWEMVKVSVWKMVCDKVGVWKMGCMKDGVYARWCVTKLCVKDVCQSCQNQLPVVLPSLSTVESSWGWSPQWSWKELRWQRYNWCQHPKIR